MNSVTTMHGRRAMTRRPFCAWWLGANRTLSGRLAFSNRFPQLRAQFRTVLVSMHLSRVLSCGIDEFTFAIRRDRDCTIELAGEIPAIDILAAHISLPDVTRANTLLSGPVLQRHEALRLNCRLS